MRPQKSVIVMPSAGHVQSALRMLRQMPSLHIALILPAAAPNLAAIEGLDQVLAWADAHGKDITLVGGSEYVCAEAVVRGLRVATSLDAWEAWLAEAKNATARLDAHLHAQGDDSGWRIIHTAYTANTAEDDLPTYFANLSPDGGTVVAMPPVAEPIPPDERYEEAVIALIWQTGKLQGEVQSTDY